MIMNDNQLPKNENLVLFILQNIEKATVTELMKLAYLIDLAYFKKTKTTKIFDFKYVRYFYGPFDSNIYQVINKLAKRNLIQAEGNYSMKGGSEYYDYTLTEEGKTLSTGLITEEERDFILEILQSFSPYGAKILTSIAYDTAPMKAIGAEIGNSNGIGQTLDFNKVFDNAN